MAQSSGETHEKNFLKKCLQNLDKNQYRSIEKDEKANDWYDFNCRTDQFIVPSSWVSRLEEANAVGEHFQDLNEKLDAEESKVKTKIDREAFYCAEALHRIRQNEFHQRLEEHKSRWDSINLIGEAARSLPRPTTDPKEIERQLFESLKKRY